jgi:hypothetical protein
MIHFGTVLYGKVDEIPGLFYVKTKFFHLNFLPLLPMDSFVIHAFTETSDGLFRGRSLGRNARSVLTAYARALLFVVIGLSLAGTLVTGLLLCDGEQCWDYLAAALLCLLGGAGLLYGTYRWARSDASRALKHAELLGISLEQLARHCVVKNIELAGVDFEQEPALGRESE